ncbi:eCIS core domain-containing protein [Thiococcus pfennigii]|jgi:hypothetical protein|uniref:eCIS core domain-containing protein n=1 Tax=Thiococcus pfennigii TaxID=1057 RepID=UPI0019082A98|nr:DUF4157 domain-containing protein [Thiococcus pfennigii]MBK1701467.1 hypothetical protein [Thiococcus pfennigii]MBK1733174.1 hypothetical protein [Thiococcus pfennigii]
MNGAAPLRIAAAEAERSSPSFGPRWLQRRRVMGADQDRFEQEADRVADRIVASGGQSALDGGRPDIQRLAGQAIAQVGGDLPASVEQTLARPGVPLEPALRREMESRFGHDFGRVRVHCDAAAARSAREVDAAAYTVGHDLVFGAGRYDVDTTQGRRLIAHELTHVVQQSGPVVAVGRCGSGSCQAVQDHSMLIQRQSVAARADEPLAGDPPAEGLQAAAAPGPRCGEAIRWLPQSPVPADITADNANEFAAKVDQALGGTPHTDCNTSYDLERSAGGAVTKVNFVLETTIIRPRLGMSRASSADKKIMKDVVDFIKRHEETHRDIARRVSQQAVCDALNKRAAEAQRVLTTAICDTLPTAQEAFDAKEGKIGWRTDSSGKVIGFAPEGVAVDYHDPACK